MLKFNAPHTLQYNLGLQHFCVEQVNICVTQMVLFDNSLPERNTDVWRKVKISHFHKLSNAVIGALKKKTMHLGAGKSVNVGNN